jgi:putative tryptophan/tyrosine transport system substrate-binding protein
MRQCLLGDNVRRREFIQIIAGSTITWTLAASAQQPTMAVIGFLSSRSPSESEAVASAFRQGLADSGYIVGRNVTVEYRWAEGRYDRLPALAAELVAMRVGVIFSAGGPPSALAAKKATTTIPIVFSAADDPVGLGLVQSLSHPGGNVTGMSLFNADLSAKRVALMHELVPAASTIAYLANPANPATRIELSGVEQAARASSIDVMVFNATNEQAIEKAFSDLSAQHIGAVIVAGEPFFDSRRALIVQLAAKYRVPASYSWRENVAMGGLVSYGTSITESYRSAGVYCGRIIKGERPADLPVMQPTRFELTINLKTAKSLGLNVPPAVLAGADEVIE